MDKKIFLVEQGSRIDYNYKVYYVDNAEDKESIDIKACCPGSVAYVISTGDVYILNNEKEWILQ